MEVCPGKDELILVIERGAKGDDEVITVERVFMFARASKIVQFNTINAHRNLGHAGRIVRVRIVRGGGGKDCQKPLGP